jgi:hypothetical protein
MVTDLTKVVALVNVQDSTFTDNYFTGFNSSLMYIQNGVLRMRRNTFRNNGLITNNQTQIVKDVPMHKFYQEHGVVLVNNSASSALPSTFLYHQIEGNTFRYFFAEYGMITIVSQNHEVLMSSNIY